jgi:soluble lytic murein transglycosylase-like protein
MTVMPILLMLMAFMVGPASQASAEIIFFANGRWMSVKDYRVDGAVVTVTLRQGGQARFEMSKIDRIAPDEVPEVVVNPASDDHLVPIESVPIEPLTPRPFSALIDTVSIKHGVSPALVHAVVQAESNYRPRAKSRVGARGLMQVMPKTAAEFGVRNLYDPLGNLEAGVQYLKFLLGRFELPLAIAAYNAGPEAVRKYGGVPPFAETQSYVAKVLSSIQP